MSPQGASQNLVNLTLQVPETLLKSLRKDKKEMAFYLRLKAAIEQYRTGELSFGQATQLAGVPKAQFLELLAGQKLSLFRYTSKELKEELEPIL